MKKIIIISVISVIVLCAIIFGTYLIMNTIANSETITTTTTTTMLDNDPDDSDVSVDQPSANDVILGLTEDAGDEYMDKIYFVGDSTTYHFHKGGIDKSHLFVPESLTLLLSSSTASEIVGSNGLTIPEALKEVNAEIVIITIGVNGADSFTEVRYKTYYKKLIDAIQEASPNTTIILQSVFPVTKAYSDLNKGITNEGINRLNEWAKEIAFDEGIRYLDTQSILKDENGAQFEEYNEEDGVHMNAAAYREIIKYIRTHAVQQGDIYE